jgi:hypothetical protein
MYHGEWTPIQLTNKQKRVLRRVLLRAFNKNQLLILQEIANNSKETITSLLLKMEKKHTIPLSTLKLNAKILRELNLIRFGNSSIAKLTKTGRVIVELLNLSSQDERMKTKSS